MIFNFFKNKSDGPRTLPIWLDDCYDDNLRYYNIVLLSKWFAGIDKVRWNVDLSSELTLTTRSANASELLYYINNWITNFDPYGRIDFNLDIRCTIPREPELRTYYEYFTDHHEKEFHPTELARGLALLLTSIENKLSFVQSNFTYSYRDALVPLFKEITLVAKALEVIYERT